MGSRRKVVLAAGAVLWRVRKRTVEVLIIHRPRYDDWSWPKGKLEPGEPLPACAVREVAEETGTHVVLGRPLPSVTYEIASGATKVCHYWAATVPAGEDVHALAARPAIKPSKNEVDQARWVPAKRALKMLTRKSDRAPLNALLDYLDEGRLDTWAVQLARHGEARPRATWTDDEESRPLTTLGRRQAADLVPLLSAFGAEEIITSPWARCHDTVAPYSMATGLATVGAPQLTETHAKDDPKGARGLVSEILRVRRPGTVLCLHRPTLPLVLDAVGNRSVYRVREVLPEEDPWLQTGELLVLHLATPGKHKARVVAAELHRT
ncbi:NUDIX hydrolase [Pseudactinotalea suaedae]|uniref:NUDIX hydrolase n=1 Tax=Pseudactinotalea suaedae TaxID=1524924 RepID=UPI0012E2D277|nr:NUDIX hydrolase [Pseudactinotalea suaedae]